MATVYRKEGEPLDILMKRFRQKVQDDEILKEVRKREFYETKNQRRRHERSFGN